MPVRHTNITLPRPLERVCRERARSLSLPLSLYFRILLANHLRSGAVVDVREEDPGKEMRVSVPFSAPPELWAAAGEAAGGVGVSRLLESLVCADVERGGGLVVWPEDANGE